MAVFAGQNPLLKLAASVPWGKYPNMQVKIFSGTPDLLQAEVGAWIQQHRHRISHVLQSQSTDSEGRALLTITLFYEEANIGTGLGFRIGS